MLKSNYTNPMDSDPTEDLKKKLLAKKFAKPDTVIPSDEEVAGVGEELKAKATPTATVPTIGAVDLKGNYTDTDEDTEDKTVGQKIGEGALAGAGGVMDMTATAMSKKGPMTTAENKAHTMNLAMKGAKTGSDIGGVFGPQGKLIGAGVGLLAGAATGLIQSSGDKAALQSKAKIERMDYIAGVKDKRKKAQMLADGKVELEKSKNVLSSQMGMVAPKYS